MTWLRSWLRMLKVTTDLGSFRSYLAEMLHCPFSPGVPLPDEKSARKYCLRAGVEAPELATIKDFLFFYIATSRPQLSSKPTVDSINTVAEWFFAGFSRITDTETDTEERARSTT